MDFLLSICIPTYNRAGFLKNALQSIVASVSAANYHKLEICISDNNSSDSTEPMIAEFSRTSPINVRYKKNEKNIGASRNFVSAMAMAEGRFINILGDDDELIPGKYDYILSLLSEHNSDDVFLFNRIDCTRDMVAVEQLYFLPELINYRKVDFRNDADMQLYFSYCCYLAGVFGYLSSIVFSRNVQYYIKELPEVVYTTAYPHVYLLFQYLLNNPALLHYYKDATVRCRRENDSFFVNPWQRFMLDFTGYRLIAQHFFSDNPLNYYSLMRILRTEHPFYSAIWLTSTVLDAEEIKKTSGILSEMGYTKTEIVHLNKIVDSFNLYQSRIKQRIKRILKIFK